LLAEVQETAGGLLVPAFAKRCSSFARKRRVDRSLVQPDMS
jgi:hypothetical protein